MTEAKTEHQFTVATHFLRLLSDYLANSGHELAPLFQATGIPLNALDDPNGRVPFDSFNRLCTEASKLLNDPSLGLSLGQSARIGYLGTHGFALTSCANGVELMQQSVRYSALVIDAAYSEFEFRDREIIRYWRSNLPDNAPLGRLQDELYQAFTVALVRYLFNRQDLAPNWVSFRHARPNDVGPYDALFRCPVYFDAANTAIGFDPEYINLPLPHANAQLRRIMDDVCARLLKALGNSLEPTWLAMVRQAVLASFSHGMPELPVIASSTGMSEDELKGKLSDRGISFRSLVDNLRQGLARGYVRDPNLSLVDITYLLGFSEQSTFQRAFKRWTGMSPGQYRKEASPET